MAKPFTNIRKSIISENLFKKLKKYLDFRHLFRYIYGFELKWDRIKLSYLDMEDMLNELKCEINDFLEKK